ncbi:conserved Plasmodium protein, unknown function [Plasmodium ovale wallikeri]|uniref:Uncharacterized protein n=1 Tax=Plasmodium ovale wallikeri TaxID=864142 RepID=A0A1A8YHR8_PLAOA|nr:conserved Plasmodium protein, unknown function [Plasmodium ovale wallikeri]
MSRMTSRGIHQNLPSRGPRSKQTRACANIGPEICVHCKMLQYCKKMKRTFLFLLIMSAINVRKYTNYKMKIKPKEYTNKIYMSSRVQLKSTKLQHRKRPRKRKKSEIYRTPVLYHPNQRDHFNLQSEYTCLPDEEILNLLSKNKLYLLLEAIKKKDNEKINHILYKDINNIYIDNRYIYYDECVIKKEKENEDNKNNIEENSVIRNDKLWCNKQVKNNNEKKKNKRNNLINVNANYKRISISYEDEKLKKKNNFVDLNNIYFYFKKVNISNINKENINEDIYSELIKLKKISIEKKDIIGYNIYKYFLNIITNIDRLKYIDNFFLVNYINNIWIIKNVHKYFYFLNCLYYNMKKIAYKLFDLNYKIDIIGHKDEKNKMNYFEKYLLFNKVIKKSNFIPNYILKHNYIYSNNILNLYTYDINTNSYRNNFDKTFKEISVDNFLDGKKKKLLNICYDPQKFEPFRTYALNYEKENDMKKIMDITYGDNCGTICRGDSSCNVAQKGKPRKNAAIDGIEEGDTRCTEGGDFQNGQNGQNGRNASEHSPEEVQKNVQKSSDDGIGSGKNSDRGRDSNRGRDSDRGSDSEGSTQWVDRLRKDPSLKYAFLEKICEKMCSEFYEMGVLDGENKIDLNKIEDIKNDKKNTLYKKVYAMRDYFYNILYNNYKPNLDLYELETFIDAEYRMYTYKKDLDTLFTHWVLKENKELPTVHFAKKDVELAKLRQISKRKRKILEFNQLFYERHGEGRKNPHLAAQESDQNGAGQRGDDESGAGQRGDDESGAGQRGDDESGAGQHGDGESGADQHGRVKKSLSCLIKWNVRSENDSGKVTRGDRDGDEKGMVDDDDIGVKDDNNEMDGDCDDEGDGDSIDFEKYGINTNDMEPYGFCDEHLYEYNNEEESFHSLNFAKLVIYDDNYDKEAFMETLMSHITTCDYKRANAIYNSLKAKGKVDTLYFKNYDHAENIAFLLRQSKERILVDVELL